jgi:outer membrane receptor protein involved in Fe transport
MSIRTATKNIHHPATRGAPWCRPLALALTTASSAAFAADSGGLQEVLVTAQKYEQKLQDVPNSISVLTGDQLQQQGDASLADYLQRVPGASFSEVPSGARTGVQITINGIANQRVFNANVDTAAALTSAVYIDDVYIVPVDPSIYDLARVEVLKGPQGTLFGQAAMGGAVKFVTNPPDASELRYGGDVTVASVSGGSASYAANGMLNLPLIPDKLALRLTASQREDGGWVDFRKVNLTTGATSITGPSVKDDFNSVDSQSGRITLKYTPTERFSVTPSFFWQSRKRTGESAINKELNAGEIRQGYFIEPRREDFYVGSLTAHYGFPKFELTSVTGYTERHYIGAQDTTAFFVTVYGKNPDGSIPGPNELTMDNTSNIFTQELRLQSNRTWLEWLQFSVGATYNKEKVDANTIWEAGEWNGGATGNNKVPSGHFSISYADTEYTNKSAYADGEVFFGKFSVGAGIRYSDQNGSYNGIGSGSALPVTWTRSAGRTLEEKRSTPRYYLSYKPGEDYLLYGSVAKGFRLGGAGISNYQTNLTPACISTLQSLGLGSYNGQYDSDEVTNFSLGAKTSWLNNRLQLNTDLFYIQWDALQSVLNLNQINSACNLSLTTNAGDATSRGVNMEMRTSFGSLDLSASVAYTEAKRGKPPAGVTAYRESDPLGGVPEWSGSLSGQYNWPVLDGAANAYLRLDFLSRSSMLTPDFTDPRDPWQNMASYQRANIRLGAQGKTYGVTLFMDNVFNDVSELGGGHAFGMNNVWRVLVMPPRTTGVRVEARF